MIHYKARARAKDGRFDYTAAYGHGGIIPVGFCKAWTDPATWGLPLSDAYISQYNSHKDRFHSDGHATAEEAEHCHYEYELAMEVSEFSGPNDTLHRCTFPGCEIFTSLGLRIGGFRSFDLCDQHRNDAGLRAAYPFKPGHESFEGAE